MSTSLPAAAFKKVVYPQGQNPGLKYIEPYYYPYKTFAKQRWHGRELLEIVSTEFRDRSVEYYRHAIEAGVTTINGAQATATTLIKNGDALQNVVHRHEPPVSAHPIQIIHVDPNGNFIVIDKPGSVPVHPSGRYYKNSCVEILESPEFGFEKIFTVNRLDRLTSGLMFFALSGKAAANIQKDFQEGRVKKVYLARVRGKFPEGTIVVEQPLLTVDKASGLVIVHPEGKEAKTTFDLQFYDEARNESVVECKPFTGRTHQIRVHLQYLGHPIPNDPIYSLTSVWAASPTHGKGGVDTVPTPTPERIQKEYGPPMTDAEREALGEEARLALLTFAPGDTSGSEEAMLKEVEELAKVNEKKRKLMPRETGADVGSSSPVLLSEEAREIIRRLRRMKDMSEDWARWKDVVLYTQEASKSPAIVNSLAAHFNNKELPIDYPKNRYSDSPNFVHKPPNQHSKMPKPNFPKPDFATDSPPSSSPPTTTDDAASPSTSTPSSSTPPPAAPTPFVPPAGFCPVCYIPLAPDPDPDRIFIYLHAVRYSTSYGEFETGLPVWAREDWNGDDGWEGRAKGQGKGGEVEKEVVVGKVESQEVVEEVRASQKEKESEEQKAAVA